MVVRKRQIIAAALVLALGSAVFINWYPADPDDIYAKLDWETNPPINGFYEMMMDLTPERRKELRELARQHNEKQAAAEKMEVKAVPDTPREQPRQEETQPEAVTAPAVTDTPPEAVATSLCPDIEAEKPKEEGVDLSPRAYHRTPEMHLREGSLVADRGRHNIGYLKDITPYGATFQPLDLKGSFHHCFYISEIEFFGYPVPDKFLQQKVRMRYHNLLFSVIRYLCPVFGDIFSDLPDH